MFEVGYVKMPSGGLPFHCPELGYQGPGNHIERWPSGHENGPDGMVASLPGHDEAQGACCIRPYAEICDLGRMGVF